MNRTFLTALESELFAIKKKIKETKEKAVFHLSNGKDVTVSDSANRVREG